jgi:hypothetical protein
MLRAQPGIADAVITEIDENSLLVEIQGIEIILDGWGSVVRIGGPGDPSNDLLDELLFAINGVRYEC